MERAREATPSDLVTLIDLWDRAVAELDGQRGGHLLAGSLVRADLGADLSRSLEDPDRLLALGFIDDVPVGVASVVCQRERREPLASMELIYVEPAARQVGVAEAMLDLVLEWCSAQHCLGVDAPALPGNRAAKAFFEGKGFLARLLTMHYQLSERSPDADG